jgi:hypothetical protein
MCDLGARSGSFGLRLGLFALALAGAVLRRRKRRDDADKESNEEVRP